MDCKKSLTLILTIICFLALVGMGVVLFVLYTEIQAHTTTLEGDAQQLQTELNATKQNLTLTLKNETQQLQAELNATKQELNTQMNETQVFQRKLKNKEKQLTTETQRLQTVQTELDATKQELNTQKNEAQQLQTELDATKQELNTQKKETQDLKDELKTKEQQIDTFIHRRTSCKDIQNNGATTSAQYYIQPNILLPGFMVTCRFSGATATTVVNHDSEMEIEMSKCQGSKCYGRSITYNVTIAQIRALIEVGGSCRQHLKYRCYSSYLHIAQGESGWDTWDGRFVNYLGGAGGRIGYCACGVTGTCANSSNKCHCESNDAVWREDSGYLTVKDDLPVTKLYFADNNHDTEHGLHTLGPLECIE